MASERPYVLVRCFEGSDCQRQWIARPPQSTDTIVYGRLVFALRVRPKAVTLVDLLLQMKRASDARAGRNDGAPSHDA